MSTRATVVVPTHDHDLTLPMAVASALAQTVPEVEVLILGDGVTAAVRAAATRMVEQDDRVTFLDLPKGEFHGEAYRDRAVREARGDAIFYLCDDDLLLPRHVENLLSLLDDHDLVQCRNGYVTTDGELALYPTDLADPAAIEWHLREPRRNCVSLTGTAHRRDTYLALDEGWTTTPPGEWPDHYMWKKFLRRPGVRAATHPEMTTVQLPTSSGREDQDQQARADELAVWVRRLGEPDAHEWLQQLVATATKTQLDATYRANIDARIELVAIREHRTTLREQLDRANHALSRERAETARLRAEVDRWSSRHAELVARIAELKSRRRRDRRELRAARNAEQRARRAYEAVLTSTSWQVTAPFRAASGPLRRARRRK